MGTEREPRCRAAGRRGVTLVEILVVIALIAFLAGLTFGVSRAVRSKAATASTQTLIDKIELVLDEYRDQWGDYPDQIGTTPRPPEAPTSAGNEQVAGLMLEAGAVDEHQINADGSVVDHWGTAIDVIRDGFNAPGLDIWSYGPDGQNDRSASDRTDYDDDIVNWAQRN